MSECTFDKDEFISCITEVCGSLLLIDNEKEKVPRILFHDAIWSNEAYIICEKSLRLW